MDYLPMELRPTSKPAQEDNAMNKSVTNLWNMHKTPSGAATPVSGAATPEVSTPQPEEVEQTPVKSKKRTKNVKETASKRAKSKKSTLWKNMDDWIILYY